MLKTRLVDVKKKLFDMQNKLVERLRPAWDRAIGRAVAMALLGTLIGSCIAWLFDATPLALPFVSALLSCGLSYAAYEWAIRCAAHRALSNGGDESELPAAQAAGEGATAGGREGGAKLTQLFGAGTRVAAVARKSSRQIASTATRLSLAIERLRDSSIEQAHASAASSAQLEHFVSGLSKVKDGANEVQRISDRAARLSASGVETIEAAGKDSREIARLISEVAERIATLSQATQHVALIIDSIRQVAAHTNILALNAAIEAARAGKSGRGFAVVADEVRRLSVQTSEAAARISRVLISIREQSELAAVGITQAVDGARTILRNAEQSEKAVVEIGVGASQAHAAFAGILESLGGLSAAADGVAHEVEAIAKRSEDNRKRAEQSLESVRRLESLGEDLYSAASPAVALAA